MINLLSVLILLACINLMTALNNESTKKDTSKRNSYN